MELERTFCKYCKGVLPPTWIFAHLECLKEVKNFKPEIIEQQLRYRISVIDGDNYTINVLAQGYFIETVDRIFNYPQGYHITKGSAIVFYCPQGYNFGSTISMRDPITRELTLEQNMQEYFEFERTMILRSIHLSIEL